MLDLSRRENKCAARKQVNVKMKHRLAPVTVSVDHDAIAVVGKTLFTSDARSCQEKLAQFFRIGSFVQRIDMLAGYHQDVRRRLRVKVIKRDAFFVLVNAFRWDFARNYLAENAVFSTHDQINQLNHKHLENVKPFHRSIGR